MRDGAACELSLAETLARAHEIGEIFDESPLVTLALHRLLLAILHRNFGPSANREWLRLWKRGRWDGQKLSDYFNRWSERFELFHLERPFFQVTEMQGVDRQPATILFQELASGNNPTLFDHCFEADPRAIPAARAARGLVARQAYSFGFGKSTPFCLSDSPLLRGLAILVLGENLFQTLALNLVRYDEKHPFVRAGDREDLPAWEHERAQAPRKEGTIPAGYLDYLTWQSRRIHLYPEPDHNSVRFCQLQQNLKLDEDAPRDPFKCYRKDEKRGWVALNFSEDKALWRDNHSLIEISGKSHSRPAVFDWIAGLAHEPGAPDLGIGPHFSFSAFGLATEAGKAASVGFWRHERLPLPLVCLSDGDLRSRIADAIGYAEEVARDLRQSVAVLARTMIEPFSTQVPQRRSDDARDRLTELAPQRLFWSALEAPFMRLMGAIADQRDESELHTFEWRKLVRRIAAQSLEQITRELDSGARALRAVAQAERSFRYHIRTKLALGEEL
jgi:CRISPR system Cascade subunit CasA